MAGVAVLLAASYPFMKRFHSLPQVHLGFAFGWAIPMAYTAQTHALPGLEGWVLYAANILWTVAYDTMYAMADRGDDKAAGVKSSALLFADYDRLMVALFQGLALLGLVLAGALKGLGGFYYAAVMAAALFFVYGSMH